MCEAVVLLLKRMESNPEEFYIGKDQPHKWRNIEANITRYASKDSHDLTYLEEHELEALWSRLKEIKKQQLHHDVMERLLSPPAGSLYEVGAPFRTERYAQGFRVSSGSGGSGVLGQGVHINPAQNAYPTLSAFAESQPPKTKPTLTEALKAKLNGL